MLVVAILGLLIPGYVLARALRAPMPWAVAFPLSVLVLTETVVVYTVLGIPIRFGYVLITAIVVVAVSFAMVRYRKTEPDRSLYDNHPQNIPKLLVFSAAVLVGVALFSIFGRTALYALSGSDTVLRWDALPRLMLQYQGLSYYPPITSEDYSKYFVPDSFPPLVATVYWWLYAAWGSACPRLTSVAILLQAASCFALAYYAARTLHGVAGGLLALIVLASSSFFLIGVEIGQENGFTAISYAGQLCFAFAAIRDPKARFVVLAGMFAALGALAREYGPLLSLSGFSVLACRRETRRYLPLFCLVCILCAGPWYVRNWVLTGNPIYPVDIGLGMPVSPVLEGLLAAYRAKLGISNFTAHYWLRIAEAILCGAPLALLVGVPGIVAAGKNRIALGISAFVAFLLWFLSIPHSSGGMGETWRFMTPGWVVLSIAAGAFGPALARAIDGRRIFLLAVAVLAYVICGGYAILCCWSQPYKATEIGVAITSSRGDPLDYYVTQLAIAKKLNESDLPSVGVLVDDCNLAVALQRNTRFQPVMIWSPEVAFVFNPHENASDVRRQLIAKNILLVAISNNRSINRRYLFQNPFHRDDLQHWLPVISLSDGTAVLLAPPP